MGRKKKSQLEETIIKKVNPDSIKISVTINDILDGKPRNEECCPIALAAIRSLQGIVEGKVTVESTYLSIARPDEEWDDSVNLPEEACQFISLYDAGDTVQPFEFEIDGKPLKRPAKKLLPENNLDKIKDLPIDKTETSDKLLDIRQARSD